MYFGYTHCPDVCPDTMARLMQVIGKLGPDAQQVRILFITVDPARDTPSALHDYVAAFRRASMHAAAPAATSKSRRSQNATASRIRWKRAIRTATTKSLTVPLYMSSIRKATRGCSQPDHDSPDDFAQDLRRIIEAHS